MKQKGIHMKRIIYIAIICAFSSVFFAKAQILTLRECLEEGLRNNYPLRVIHNERQISKNNATLRNAGYLSTLGFSAEYTGNLDNIEIKARTTGEITRNNGVYDQTVNAGLNPSWTVFNGFNISTTYKQLKELERQGETNTHIAVKDFITALTSGYYNFIQQKICLKSFHYAVSPSKERLHIAKVGYLVGKFSGLDYQQTKVDFNADSTQYIRQQELLYSSRIQLNELAVNNNINQNIIIGDSIIDVHSDLQFDDLRNSILATNASLLKADQNTVLAQLDYKRVSSRNYPYLKLNTEYGYMFNKYDINTNSRRGELGFNAEIIVGFDAFDGNRRHGKRNASLAFRNRCLERQDLELVLRSNLSNLWRAYRNNSQLLNLKRQSLITAKDNHDVVMGRYIQGDLSGFGVCEAQESLLNAEEYILSAEYNTKLYEIPLLQISGETTKYLE